jgi:hypothetical protein
VPDSRLGRSVVIEKNFKRIRAPKDELNVASRSKAGEQCQGSRNNGS